MKKKNVEFCFDPATAYYCADFLNGDQLLESKVLTVAEYEGLAEIYDFSTLPFTVSVDDLINSLDDIFFDVEDEGHETNFEIILKELNAAL